MSKIKPLARKSEIVVQEFGNEILIYDLQTNKAFSLNETSALIWQLSNGNLTSQDIATRLSIEFDSAISEDFVMLALDQLKKDNLVEVDYETPFFDGLSRRDVIRKIGLTSMIAFPIITSLTAPLAVHAQSCTYTNPPCNGNGTICSRSTDCCTCCCRANSVAPGPIDTQVRCRVGNGVDTCI